jgi:hypothetical protein
MWTEGETVRRGERERERERDVSKVIAADRYFANAPKITSFGRYVVDSKIILK